MDKIFTINLKIAFLIFAFLDLICVGMGMGVPIFCILFGFLVGWYIARRVTLNEENPKEIFKKVFSYAIRTSLFTLAVMVIIWGPTIELLFKPEFDFKNFGIPLILYDPKLSFIGWLILMIFISPFLQLLTTIFASYVILLKWFKREPVGKYIWRNNRMSKDYILKFDLLPYSELESFARQANKKENLGDKGDWLNHFLWGMDGLRARILGIKIHYHQIHSWDLVESLMLSKISYGIIELRLYEMTEYHLSTIFFNMDSAIECIVFTLNALGYAVDSTKFKDVTNEKELRDIIPENILGKRSDCTKGVLSGYDNYFPSLKVYWAENRDLIDKISEQHNVSKHRSAIFQGGKHRMDPPPEFFEKLGIKDKSQQIVISPFAEIVLPLQPKLPWHKRDPKENIKLEDIVNRFQAFINMSGVKALEDAKNNIQHK
jgi:hypothetical protein